MNIPGISNITNMFDDVVERLTVNKKALDQIKSVFGGDQKVDLGDTFTQRHSAESLSGHIRTPVEWMGSAGRLFGMALERLGLGYATSDDWNKKFSNAVDVLKGNFDLLDTAAGIGGKDGFIGKNDLEAAMRNPDIPKEVRDACRFLLENPSAWNQLDVGAGIGNCDGIIAKCDVDAVSARLAEQAAAAEDARETGEVDETADLDEAGEPDEIDDADGVAGADGPDGAEEAGEAGNTADLGATNDTSTTGTAAASRAEHAESLVTNLLESLDTQLDTKTKELDEMVRSGKRDTHTLTLELQRIAEQRKQMFELLSTLSKMHNEMAKTAIQNMGRA